MDAGILNEPWPLDLDPETAGFRVRTVTILRRKGIWDDMTRLDKVTEDDVLGWVTAGVKTVADLRGTGNAAIAAHHASAPKRERQAAELAWMVDRLARVAGEAWTAQVWGRDPRFRDLLPRSDATVAEIIREGDLKDQLELWASTDQLEARIGRLAVLPLAEAVAGYVEAISGQHGIRLEALLAYTGLGGRDPITGSSDFSGESLQRGSLRADVVTYASTQPANIGIP